MVFFDRIVEEINAHKIITDDFGGVSTVQFGLPVIQNSGSMVVYGDSFEVSSNYIGPDAVVYHDLSVSVSGSGVTNPAVGIHSYIEGSVASVSATADSGYQFYSCGACHWCLNYWVLNAQ